MQFIDPPLLRERLLESLWYYHAHPPLLNLFTGVGLKFFGDHADVYFVVCFHALGLALALAVYILSLRLTCSRAAAVVANGLLVFSPAFVLYENWLMYTLPSAALLTISALLLHQYLATRRLRWAVAFFSTLAILLLTRSMFHLAWMGLVVVLLALASGVARGCCSTPRRRVLVREELLLLPRIRGQHGNGHRTVQHHDSHGGARGAAVTVSGGPSVAVRAGVALRAAGPAIQPADAAHRHTGARPDQEVGWTALQLQQPADGGRQPLLHAGCNRGGSHVSRQLRHRVDRLQSPVFFRRRT